MERRKEGGGKGGKGERSENLLENFLESSCEEKGRVMVFSGDILKTKERKGGKGMGQKMEIKLIKKNNGNYLFLSLDRNKTFFNKRRRK